LAPILLKYRDVHEALGVERNLTEIRLFSADVAALGATSPLSAMWARLSAVHRAEQQLFPGVTAALIAAIGAVVCARQGRGSPATGRWVRLPLACAAVALATAAAVAAAAGPWRIAIGGRTLATLGVASKPLTLAIWCAIGYVVTGPRFAAALHRQ